VFIGLKEKLNKNVKEIKLTYSRKINLNCFFIFDLLRKIRFFHYRFHYPYINLHYKKSKVSISNRDQIDKNKFERLVTSITKSKTFEGDGLWNEITKKYQREVIVHLKNKDYSKIESILANPLSNDLMFGFDNLAKSLRSILRIETITECSLTADNFLALAEYLGVINYQSPESLVSPKKKFIDLNPILDQIIYKVFGKSISFPNFYMGEIGVYSKFGIASLRVPSSIYQAIQVSNIGNKICEIGPGLGRTAYFSKLLGAKKYTLVDIPLSSLTQGYFLMRSLPEIKYSCSGESDIEEGIEFRTPDQYFKGKGTYDVVLNVDSLTELDILTARKYLTEIIKRSKYFLSINHEQNDFTIRNLAKEFKELSLISSSRSWIRQGYIEELYKVDIQ